MIPRSIKLKGFLCYKDEQTLEFDGSTTLWMLTGLNGSGKSAIFDAVTFILFGHHRGGGTNNQELINKDAAGFVVEFEFLLDDHRYRLKRTLKRKVGGGSGASTQQVSRLEGGTWVAVDGTHLKRGFDDWIRDNIGLTYDTFTSSVLLLQGDAEKLLNSRAEARREVLAGIVDLGRYEQLHERADSRRKELDGQLKALSHRLGVTPAVEPLELAAAGEAVLRAEEARNAATEDVDRLKELELRAKAWQDLQGRAQQARARHDEARLLLGQAEAIAEATARLRELREVLPHIRTVVEQRATIYTAEQRAKELGTTRQRKKDEWHERDNALKQARDKRETLRKLIAADEEQHRTIVNMLRQSTARMEKLKEYERHDADLQRALQELAGLPEDVEADKAKAREAVQAVEAVAAVVPLLERFHGHRAELALTTGRARTACERKQAVETRGKECAAATEALRPKLAEATKALEEANVRSAEAGTLLKAARDSLRDLVQVDGAKVCRHCGQPLTAAHVKEEQKRRKAAVAAADDKATEAGQEQQAARDAEQGLRNEFARADKALVDARLEFQNAQNLTQQAKADVERLQLEVARDFAELPEAHRQRIGPGPAADWAATTFPTADDLQGARAEAAGLPPARAALHRAEQAWQQWNTGKARESAVRENLNRLQSELPANHKAMRAEHQRLENEDRVLQKNLEANRALARDVEQESDRLDKDRQQAQAHLDKIAADIRDQQLVEEHARRAVDRALKALPEAWQEAGQKAGMRELHTLDTEKETLVHAGTEDKATQLEQARLTVNALRAEQERLEAEQDTYPAEARVDPAALQRQLVEARQRDRTIEDELNQARQHKALLENRRRQREEIEEEYLATDKELSIQKLLAELLGRERLQLYLVRQAERQVVEHANTVLDRLSSGQLYLKLRGEADGEGSSAKALELEAYNRVTGERPINVAFLSGSQKFRVAVSLALGIGQYASRQHRPIESVIIDEGFGCLDRFGRQVMVQELQNLRGQMRCILLVSHQEEFADSFPDGYHFELEAGATRVTRFQR
jgi:DNA repair exonuclease SbcCD ATPase subunit